MNETVLLTGGSGGLGSVVCSKLLAEGYKIISVDRSHHDSKDSDNLVYVHLDLNDLESIPSALVDLDFDHLVLVHGVLEAKNFLDLTVEDFTSPLRINFLSNFIITQLAIKKWLSNKSKINFSDNTVTYISSVATKGASQTEVPYLTSKRAFEGVLLACAREFSDDGIRSNVISPGIMNVGMGESVLRERPDVLDRLPIKSPTDPKEIADLIIYLLKAKHVTGQNMHVNSGRYFSI